MVKEKKSKVGETDDMVPSTSGRLDMDSFPHRVRFHVDLSESNYTVSWKDLQTLIPEDAPLAPDMKKAKGVDRMQKAVERIEKMYHGHDSDEEHEEGRRRRSEGENGNGTDADDDTEDQRKGRPVEQYDTDDSFIDDEELDDYFEVETVGRKHKGYFINRGEIEIEEEPQTRKVEKKKRVPSGERGGGGSDPRKKARARKENVQSISEIYKRDDKQKDVRAADRNTSESATTSTKKKKTNERTVEGVIKPKSSAVSEKATVPVTLTTEKVSNEDVDTETSTEEAGSRTNGNTSSEAEMSSDGMKADGDQSSNTTRRAAKRGKAVQNFPKEVLELPPEVKLKLRKVARLAEKQKKLTDKLYGNLMTLLGHLTGLDNLKRETQETAEHVQTAEAEKQNKLNSMKLEIMDMVTARLELSHGQENKSKFTWDAELEDRLHDLHIVHKVHVGAPTKKFYPQLVGLWPEGIMDSESVRAAIARAKERRKDAMLRME